MYKYILEKAGDLDWMAIVPLLIFTIVFVIITIRAFTHKKDFINHMANMPLDKNETLDHEKELKHDF
ncbi:MAG: CcoQ/FixQ family Cbb3-type cytochrome c oxidase assembly chaperone [Saprospiraceae bacterium]